METLTGACKKSNGSVLTRPESGVQAGVRALLHKELQSATNKLPLPFPHDFPPETTSRASLAPPWAYPILEQPLPMGTGLAWGWGGCLGRTVMSSFRGADQHSGRKGPPTALCLDLGGILPKRGRACLRRKRLEPLNTAVPEACTRPLITRELINSLLCSSQM